MYTHKVFANLNNQLGTIVTILENHYLPNNNNRKQHVKSAFSHDCRLF